jgi:hypothetical protein
MRRIARDLGRHLVSGRGLFSYGPCYWVLCLRQSEVVSSVGGARQPETDSWRVRLVSLPAMLSSPTPFKLLNSITPPITIRRWPKDNGTGTRARITQTGRDAE